jgi:hypothetical protein
MKPPICELCDKDFRKELETDQSSGGLVCFSDLKPLDEGLVGHPQGAAWFCKEHYQDAQFLSELSMSMAMEQLRNKYRL